jgi:tetratricopeptide (TPR) repeat protein
MAHAKTSLRAEQRAMRDRMRAAGMSHQQIAVEFARRYGLRPRAAWRNAHGWSQTEAAEQINRRAGDTGLDPSGAAAMTGPHLCEYENWPGEGPKLSGRRPTPLVLALLAAAYGTPAIHDLLDLADYQNMPAADRLVLNATVHAESQPGNGARPSRHAARAHVVDRRAPHRRPHSARPPALPAPGGQTRAPEAFPPALAPLATALLSAPRVPAGAQVVLADEAVRIWKLRQAARYRELAVGLPEVLARARSREAEPDASWSPTGLAALAHLYNAASSLAKNLGSFELAGIAADRAVRTADRTGDPLLAGAAAYRLANVLLSAGHNAAARALAVSAADRLRPILTATASHTAMWGALLATAAQAAGREHAAAEAWELLGASKVAAGLLATEQADLFSVFGPASWLVHAVNIAADLGDGAEATRRAAQIPAGRLPPMLAERRAFLLLGKARGHALRADLTAATETLLEAEQAAPEEFRHNTEARKLVLQLLTAGPRPGTLLRDLAARTITEATPAEPDRTSP